MILGRLFKALFARGVVVVATSNTTPDDLFAGQPGRDAFLPFIALIKQYLDVLVLGGSRDFRRQRVQPIPPGMSPPGRKRARRSTTPSPASPPAPPRRPSACSSPATF